MANSQSQCIWLWEVYLDYESNADVDDDYDNDADDDDDDDDGDDDEIDGDIYRGVPVGLARSGRVWGMPCNLEGCNY